MSKPGDAPASSGFWSAIRKAANRLQDWFVIQSVATKLSLLTLAILIPLSGAYSVVVMQKQAAVAEQVRTMSAPGKGGEGIWTLNSKLPVVFGTGSMLSFLETNTVDRITVIYRPLTWNVSERIILIESDTPDVSSTASSVASATGSSAGVSGAFSAAASACSSSFGSSAFAEAPFTSSSAMGHRPFVIDRQDPRDLPLRVAQVRARVAGILQKRVFEEGAEVKVVGAGGAKSYTSKHGYPVNVDLQAEQVSAVEFDAVIVPGGYAPEKLLIEIAPLVLVLITISRQRNLHRQHVLGFDAEVGALHRNETSHHQAGADEQYQRKGDFCDNERASQSACPASEHRHHARVRESAPDAGG